jgi:two-component system phosphate regulon response regulator PhoB
MKKINVLVVEDEPDIQQLVSYNLLKAGFNVSCADSGEQALRILAREEIDCVLLDLMLPGMNGLEVCSAMKSDCNKRYASIPIIMLTARGEEEDVVSGFQCGADDYITKPFSPRVLVARLHAVVGRSRGRERDSRREGEESLIEVERLVIDRGRHLVTLNGRELQLTMTEFGILALLAGKPGWVFSRQQIIDAVRGYDFLVTSRAVDVQIFGLRRKMGEFGSMIETVRGIGYRCKSPDKEENRS